MEVPIFLKDIIDFDEVASILAKDLTTLSLQSIYQEFTQFFWDISDCDYWFYTEDQARKHIEFLKARFLEEYYIFPHKIASDLGLEVIES